MTPVERYHQALREIGCVACIIQHGAPSWPVAIHHLFDAHERNEYLTAPLCEPGHHQHGKGADIFPFHPGGERRFRAVNGFGEKELLAETIKQYARRRA